MNGNEFTLTTVKSDMHPIDAKLLLITVLIWGHINGGRFKYEVQQR